MSCKNLHIVGSKERLIAVLVVVLIVVVTIVPMFKSGSVLTYSPDSLLSRALPI